MIKKPDPIPPDEPTPLLKRLGITDVMVQALIAAFVTLILGWMSHATKQAVVAVDASVKESTVLNSTKIGQIHELVNSNFTTQLKLTAVALRRVADLTKHPDDIKAATLAEKLLSDREDEQKKIDIRGKQP